MEFIAENNYQHYERHYNENDFWSKVRRFGKKMPALREAMAMYYCLKDPETPIWVKPLIIGALGYFIFPIDAVPDVIPVAGFADDAAVVTAVLAIIHVHIREQHWKQADECLN